MHNKLFFVLILILGFGLSEITGQETISSAPAKSSSAANVINGKAKSLPKPAYPAAARAVNAGGAVDVQITIDENGEVISASAVSGHPLLRAAAEQAARQAKFDPTVLEGQPVRVTGILVYYFVSPAGNPPAGAKFYMMNWSQTGMLLSALEKMPTLRFFEPAMLLQSFPNDWTAERQQVQRLNELKKAEMDMPTANPPKSKTIDSRTTVNPNDGTALKVETTNIIVAPERTASAESAAIAQSLIVSIQGRLGAEPLNLWHFNLGLNINKGFDKADSRVKQERLDSAEILRAFVKTAPPEINENLIQDLQKLSLLIEKGIFTNEDKIAATQLMTRLNTISGN